MICPFCHIDMKATQDYLTCPQCKYETGGNEITLVERIEEAVKEKPYTLDQLIVLLKLPKNTVIVAVRTCIKDGSLYNEDGTYKAYRPMTYEKALEFMAAFGNVSRDSNQLAESKPTEAQLMRAFLYAVEVKRQQVVDALGARLAIERKWEIPGSAVLY